MMIDCLDPSVRLMGRWFRINGKAVEAAPGSYFQIAFQGQDLVLHFKVDLLLQPRPHLWISVDGGDRVEVPLDKLLRVHTHTPGNHVVEVIHKSSIENAPRWFGPLVTRVELLGYEADAPGVLPEQNKKTIEFVGDSITEGVLVDHETGNDITWEERPYQDDSAATYAWRTAEKLGVAPIIMGYGSVGVTTGGCGSVPAAAEAYPYCFHGAPIPYSNCDYIVINHGTNDRGKPAEKFIARYTQLLDVICAHNPTSQIVIVTPFCGAWEKELKQLAESYTQATGRKIAYICTTGWISPERIHPDRAGHEAVATHLAEELRKLGV